MTAGATVAARHRAGDVPAPHPVWGLVHVSESELGGWRRRRPTTQQLGGDVALAASLCAFILLNCWLGERIGNWEVEASPPWVWVVFALACTVPLVWRRRHPLVVLVLSMVTASSVDLLRIPEYLGSSLCLYLAFFTVGAWATARRLGLVLRLGIAVSSIVWLTWAAVTDTLAPSWEAGRFSREGEFSQYDAYWIAQLVITILFYGFAWFFGEMAYRSALRLSTLRQRSIDLEAERTRSAEQAIALDRLRVARELHDAVAHHVSVMGVQAGAARLLLDTSPDGARKALATVEDSARSAIDELQGMLLTLRDGGETAATEASSTRGVDAIPGLVAQASEAGNPTQYTVVGTALPLSPAADLTAYRVVQEALTNVRKHAGPGATADVRLRYLGDLVELDIIDTGFGPAASVGRGAGGRLGLLGMRERVAAVGGAVETGPADTGGYRVRVSLPTQQSAPTGRTPVKGA